MPKLDIDFVELLDGDLYEVNGEDGNLIVSDTYFVAVTRDGRRFLHRSHRVRGFCVSEDGNVPNYNFRARAEPFAARVEARGSIDLSYWRELKSSR